MNVASLESGHLLYEDGTLISQRYRRPLKPFLNIRGYPCYRFMNHGHLQVRTIHRLLAENFLPNPEGLPVINHKDGNKANNSLDNLEWCTFSQNNAHAYRTGLKIPRDVRGVKNPRAKLTESKVARAREYSDLGLPKWAIAQQLGIHRSTLHRILAGATWRHL